MSLMLVCADARHIPLADETVQCKHGHTMKVYPHGRIRRPTCESEHGKALRTANPEKYRAKGRAEQSLRRKRKPVLVRHENWAWMLRREYGMSVADYEALLSVQGGRCAICNCPPRANCKLNVDHDHQTGKVRGLLCGHCNSGVGYFRDNPELLNASIQYLRKEAHQYGVASCGSRR